MQAGLTNIEVGFQEYEWEEQLEKLNMEHIVFSINFLNLYLLSTDYLHTGLILLGCGLLVSSITFTAEHFLCCLQIVESVSGSKRDQKRLDADCFSFKHICPLDNNHNTCMLCFH